MAFDKQKDDLHLPRTAGEVVLCWEDNQSGVVQMAFETRSGPGPGPGTKRNLHSTGPEVYMQTVDFDERNLTRITIRIMIS